MLRIKSAFLDYDNRHMRQLLQNAVQVYTSDSTFVTKKYFIFELTVIIIRTLKLASDLELPIWELRGSLRKTNSIMLSKSFSTNYFVPLIAYWVTH